MKIAVIAMLETGNSANAPLSGPPHFRYIEWVAGIVADSNLEIVKSRQTLDPRLRRFLTWAILLLTAGYTFLDYWEYSRVQHADPESWQLLATGHGIAPAQYRIGVYFTANFLAHLTHLQLRHIFACADFVCTGISLAFLFLMLTRVDVFRRADSRTQWAQAVLGLLLVQLGLSWCLWFQEPETMPSLAILAASALLCSGVLRMDSRVSRWMLAISLLLVALLGSTIRVDAVIAFHAGFLLAALLNKADAMPLGRLWQAATSLLALLLALGTERFLAHTLFPHAVRNVALIQLPVNLHTHNGLLVLLFSLPPWVLTVWLGCRHWERLRGWARGLLIGSLIHFAMFLTFGMSEEVRIFIPFVLALLPVSVPLLLTWFAGDALSLEN